MIDNTWKSFHENERLCQNIFFYMNEGLAICEIIFDESGQPYDYRYLEVNPAFTRIIGLSADEVRGKSLGEFGYAEPYWLDLFGEVVKTGEHGSRLDYSAGSGKWFDLKAFSLGDKKFAFLFTDVTESKKVDGANCQAQGSIVNTNDITHRKRMEEELRKSEQKYKDLVRHAPAGIWEVDFRSKRFVSVNDALCQISGYTREELLEMNPFDILDEQGKITFQYRINQWLAGEKPDENVEYKITMKDGHEIFAVVNVTFTRDEDGKPVGATVVGHDITERKHTEQVLRESEERFRSVLDNSRDLIYQMNLQTGRYEYVSPSSELVTGYSPDELMALDDLTAIIHPEDSMAVQKALTQLDDSGKVEVECRLVKTGDHRWFSHNVSLTRDNAGQPLYRNGNIRDITEQKKAEAVLRDSEARHSFLLELSDLLHPLSDAYEIASTAVEALGKHMGVDRVGFISVMGNDKNEKVSARWVVAGITDYSGNYHTRDLYKAMADETCDGMPIIMSDVRDFPLTTEDAASFAMNEVRAIVAVPILKSRRPVGGVYVHQRVPRKWTEEEFALIQEMAERTWAVVERAKAEEALRESEEKYRKIVNTANEGIWLTDPQGRITYLNEIMAKWLGYSVEELLGRKTLDFVVEEDLDECYGHKEKQKSGICERYDFKLKKKDGSYLWVIVSDTSFNDTQGNFDGYLTMFTDITERKKLEKELTFQAHVLTSVHDAICALDENFIVTYWNDMAEEMFGWTKQEAIGQSSKELLKAIVPGSAREDGIGEMLKVGYYKGDVIYQHKDGREIYTHIHANVIRGWNGEFREIVASFRDITERKKLEEQLYKAAWLAEQRANELDAIISAVGGGLVIYDSIGKIIRINEYAQKTFGYSSADFKISYLERGINLHMYNSDYEAKRLPLHRALHGETVRDEEVLLMREGKAIWILLSLVPIRDGIGHLTGAVSTFIDITKRKRKTDEIRASERELLKVTLNSLGEGVLAVDEDEKIIFINEAAANLTGFSPEVAMGRPLKQVLDIKDDKTHEPLSQIPTQAVFGHLILMTRDLREVAVSVNSAPIKAKDGQIIGTVIILQDITEKQKIEQELLKAAKLDSLGILAGGVAHDFNNILAGILANLQMAKMKLKNQDISKYIESTIEITRKASDLTKQLLTFAKGGDPVKKSAVIGRLVKDTVRFALSGSKVKPEFHLPEDLRVVDIDEGQIVQVVNNLTINAEQAMPNGGILEIYGENVDLEISGQYHPGQYVKLTVKDHGIGIPDEIINKIFDPFFTTKKTGNGLGLSSSYSIIKKHNGYLEVESTPGIGTSFYIFLPASMKELTLKESQKEIATSGEAKILLMDDEDTIRNVGGEMLTCFGYQVTLARDGQEAIDLYKQAKEIGERFELVIMDLTVPGGLGGIETMAILRQFDPEIKAIISSGYASNPVMSDYERYGFSGVVIKPYKFEELIEVLNKVIDKKQLPLDFTY